MGKKKHDDWYEPADEPMDSPNVDAIKEELVADAVVDVSIAAIPATANLPKIPVHVFCAAQPNKWDQMVGFISYVKRNKLGPMTIPEWSEQFIQFMTRPVR